MNDDCTKRRQPLQNELLQPQRGDDPPLIWEYVPNADFQFWLQRISRAVILCLVSCLALIIFCECAPVFKDALYAFFRLILIPVKPLLIAQTSAAFSGFVSVLASLSGLLNALVVPLVASLAVRAGRLSSYLCIRKRDLLILQKWSSAAQANQFAYTPSSELFLNIGDSRYKVLRSVPLSSLGHISVARPKGNKSYRDYVLQFSAWAPEWGPDNKSRLNTRMMPPLMRIRWGDIVKAEDRRSFLNFLEQTFPQQIDATIFEPFKQLPDRQSYTELWLRELSGAPKRDKLTPLAEGARLAGDNYTVLRKVGVGGQGTVYLADSRKHAEDRNDLVILKEFVLPVFPDLRVRKKAAERFQAEASMLSRLNHPQIARFLDLFVEDHRAYLVLEHVEGTTLKDMVAAEGAFPEKQVIQLSLQIAEILVYLHSQTPPVIHRDLTPDNIMLGPDGLARLIDFSVAQELSSGVTGSVVGKPNYISPEQFRGKPNAQSDIYSLGATMFYLLCGHDPPPITSLHPQAENSKISSALDAIIARCTQLDTNRRYESAVQVLADLRAI